MGATISSTRSTARPSHPRSRTRRSAAARRWSVTTTEETMLSSISSNRAPACWWIHPNFSAMVSARTPTDPGRFSRSSRTRSLHRPGKHLQLRHAIEAAGERERRSSDSGRETPAPRPSSNRPPDSTSSVATSLARRAGWR